FNHWWTSQRALVETGLAPSPETRQAASLQEIRAPLGLGIRGDFAKSERNRLRRHPTRRRTHARLSARSSLDRRQEEAVGERSGLARRSRPVAARPCRRAEMEAHRHFWDEFRYGRSRLPRTRSRFVRTRSL